MKASTWRLLPLLCLALAVAGGCSGKTADSGYGSEPPPGHNLFYMGELPIKDVLGVEPDTGAANSLSSQKTPGKLPFVPLDSSILLVQSGSMTPDDDMFKAMSIYYNVSLFSGIPDTSPTSGYAASLRMAAENNGCDAILVYWGVVETTETDHQSKIISWFPLIGGAIPDETHHMRIRLKIALIDTKTGQWDMFIPRSFEDTASSSRFNREAVDQGQVDLLKAKAYRSAVNEIVKRYSRELN